MTTTYSRKYPTNTNNKKKIESDTALVLIKLEDKVHSPEISVSKLLELVNKLI